jgi:hypothetical protein
MQEAANGHDTAAIEVQPCSGLWCDPPQDRAFHKPVSTTLPCHTVDMRSCSGGLCQISPNSSRTSASVTCA